MDINQLKTREYHESGSKMRVVGPDNKPTDFYITVRGPDSLSWEQCLRKIDADPDIKVAELMALMTADWKGLENNGKPVVFSHESAVDLYENAPYIKMQVDKYIGNRKNFLKPNSKK